MGQYYVAVFLDTDGTKYVVYTTISDSSKLTEHSYKGNRIIQVCENLLRPGGKCYRMQVVWAGDYADSESNSEQNLYNMSDQMTNLTSEPPIEPGKIQFLVNHTQKKFVDMTKISNHKYGLHPLPILTCEGNGRGGGDYQGEDPDNLVGSWARNEISMEGMRPPPEFQEISFQLFDT